MLLHLRSGLALISSTLLVFPLALGCSKAPKAENIDATTLFAGSCARCHGSTGAGGLAAYDGGPAPRNFRDHAFQIARKDEDLRRAIVEGKGTAMPAFGAMFSDAQLAGLVAKIRSFDQGVRP